jgi:hypothetical protein
VKSRKTETEKEPVGNIFFINLLFILSLSEKKKKKKKEVQFLSREAFVFKRNMLSACVS